MFKIVSFAALVALAQAGGPVGYGGYAVGPANYGYAAQAQVVRPAYATAVHAAPIHQVHAAPVHQFQAVHAAPVQQFQTVHAAPIQQFQAVHAAPIQQFQAVHAAPIHKLAVAKAVEPFDPHPQYNFGYAVHDSITGDHHSHSESRDGDVVKGQYSLLDADGLIRTVTYTSDAINGFNAVVDRSPPAVQKVAVAPAFVKQPIAVHAAPVHHGQIHAVHAGHQFSHPIHAAQPIHHQAPAQFQAVHAGHQFNNQVHAVHAAPNAYHY